ncbi:hypothetical protein LCGC14_0694240 [marine sediment metagenome]|uniref:Uncharacterized protein n=1 Tax=marine sediment metagenome TaxID=412755 RepID=A0A0F9R4X2_9ZZZZ
MNQKDYEEIGKIIKQLRECKGTEDEYIINKVKVLIEDCGVE